ncbi:MAG: BlaI/MecI/CopY family transcriptional regulator [Ruminococcaceae bacterium]|nr:BlaI/MecI/CopY family transcriptional regulator [Oscillospiraceae bacterium]MBQ8898256.1 BlaI/MecI/CopY family transcriptional regulator [Clostridia bacterium]
MEKYHLSPAEWRLMKVLWAKNPITMPEILAETDKDTTWTKAAVIVMLQRLEKKGKVRISGTRNLHYYEPLIPREPIAQKETADMIERVYDGSVSDMLAAMAKSGAIPKEEIPKLREILDSCESEIK